LAGSLRRDYTEGKNLTYLFSVSSTSKNFNIQLLDAFITYSVFQSLDLEKPFLRASFGQQKKPFGLEAQATEEFKPVIRTAQAAVNLGLDPRDLGVVIRGDLFPHVDYGFNYRVPLIEYSFGVINGSGPNALDDNNDKDFVGRLVFNAPADYNNFFRGLSIGGSYYNGRKNATLTNGSASLTRKGTKDRWGADIAYVNTPVGFTFEYYRGDDYTLTGTPASPQQRVVKSEGYTATVFYNFGEQFVRGFKSQDRYDDWYPLTYQPFVRYDHWDPNINATGNRTDIWTAGFNWFFAETTKLQLNYNRKRTEVNGAKDRFDEFLVQFQFGF
jgi:phosphate-selective porin